MAARSERARHAALELQAPQCPCAASGSVPSTVGAIQSSLLSTGKRHLWVPLIEDIPALGVARSCVATKGELSL